MKRRLIAVALLTATSLFGLPTLASAASHAHITHVVKTQGPPYCC